MQFSNVALAAFFGLTSAAPSLKARADDGPTPIVVGDKFGLVLIKTGTDLQNTPVKALTGDLYAGLIHQGATCEGTSDVATFEITTEGELKLFGSGDKPQSLYVDISTTGQGTIGFTTGDAELPTHATRTTFALTAKNGLTFNGESFVACPFEDGTWTLYAGAGGVAQPTGKTGCEPVAVSALKVDAPVPCTYTS